MTDQAPIPDPLEVLFQSQQDASEPRHPKFNEVTRAIVEWTNLWREFDDVCVAYHSNRRGSVGRLTEFLHKVAEHLLAFPKSEVNDRKSFEQDLSPCEAALLSLLDDASGGDSRKLRSKLNRDDRPDLRNAASLQHALVNTILYAETEVRANEPVSEYSDPKMEERDKFIYETRKSGATNSEIIAKLEKISEKNGWKLITAPRSISEATKRYCLSTGASALPRDKGGRPSKTRK